MAHATKQNQGLDLTSDEIESLKHLLNADSIKTIVDTEKTKKEEIEK